MKRNSPDLTFSISTKIALFNCLDSETLKLALPMSNHQLFSPRTLQPIISKKPQVKFTPTAHSTFVFTVDGFFASYYHSNAPNSFEQFTDTALTFLDFLFKQNSITITNYFFCQDLKNQSETLLKSLLHGRTATITQTEESIEKITTPEDEPYIPLIIAELITTNPDSRSSSPRIFDDDTELSPRADDQATPSSCIFKLDLEEIANRQPTKTSPHQDGSTSDRSNLSDEIVSPISPSRRTSRLYKLFSPRNRSTSNTDQAMRFDSSSPRTEESATPRRANSFFAKLSSKKQTVPNSDSELGQHSSAITIERKNSLSKLKSHSAQMAHSPTPAGRSTHITQSLSLPDERLFRSNVTIRDKILKKAIMSWVKSQENYSFRMIENSIEVFTSCKDRIRLEDNKLSANSLHKKTIDDLLYLLRKLPTITSVIINVAQIDRNLQEYIKQQLINDSSSRIMLNSSTTDNNSL